MNEQAYWDAINGHGYTMKPWLKADWNKPEVDRDGNPIIITNEEKFGRLLKNNVLTAAEFESLAEHQKLYVYNEVYKRIIGRTGYHPSGSLASLVEQRSLQPTPNRPLGEAPFRFAASGRPTRPPAEVLEQIERMAYGNLDEYYVRAEMQRRKQRGSWCNGDEQLIDIFINKFIRLQHFRRDPEFFEERGDSRKGKRLVVKLGGDPEDREKKPGTPFQGHRLASLPSMFDLLAAMTPAGGRLNVTDCILVRKLFDSKSKDGTPKRYTAPWKTKAGRLLIMAYILTQTETSLLNVIPFEKEVRIRFVTELMLAVVPVPERAQTLRTTVKDLAKLRPVRGAGEDQPFKLMTDALVLRWWRNLVQDLYRNENLGPDTVELLFVFSRANEGVLFPQVFQTVLDLQAMGGMPIDLFPLLLRWSPTFDNESPNRALITDFWKKRATPEDKRRLYEAYANAPDPKSKGHLARFIEAIGWRLDGAGSFAHL